MRSRRSDIIAVVFFLLIVGVFFRQTIIEGKLPVPSDALVGLYHPWRDLYSVEHPRGIPFKNFLITDPVRQQIPWRKIVIDQWKQGHIPLWNPNTFSGVPLLANIQSAVLYPLNVLFLIFPFIDAWTMLILLQPLLGGLFMYWYLRSLGLRAIASLLGAITWIFSGFNIAWMTWGTISHVSLWLPLALLSIDMSFPRRRESNITALKTGSPIKSGMTRIKILLWTIIFITTLTFQFFAGHAQVSLYFILVVIAYGTTRILQVKERKKEILLFGLLLSVSALLTALQWVPLLDWIRQSSRVIEGSNWHTEGWFIPWAHLIQFIAPDFFGNPTTLNYWGQWNYGEFVGYVGALPLIFTILAILFGRTKSRLFWVVILAVAFLFALPTPIAYLPFILKVPILSSLQPTRLLFILDFSLAMLAAFGCNDFLEGSKKRRLMMPIVLLGFLLMALWGIIVASRLGMLDPSLRGSLEVSMRNLVMPSILFIAAAAMLVMYQQFRVATLGNIIAWMFVGFVAVDLLRFGWKFTPFTPREYFFPETKVISFLKQQPQPFRVMSVDKRILPPNTASYFGIESIEGYDPIISSRYEELLATIARGAPDIRPPFGFNRIISFENLSSPLLPMLNVRYVLSLSNLQDKYFLKVLEEGETKVYEDRRVFPRIYIAQRPIVTFGKEETMKALYAIKDLRREAVVEGNVSILAVPMGGDESVSLTRYESDRLEIETKLSVPRLLVIGNAYHPGWLATVDGLTTKIYRTNFAFQGVIVPQGTHRVTLTFTQW